MKTRFRAAHFMAVLAALGTGVGTAGAQMMQGAPANSGQGQPAPAGSTQLPAGAAAQNQRFFEQLQQMRGLAGQGVAPAQGRPAGSMLQPVQPNASQAAKPSPSTPASATTPMVQPAIADASAPMRTRSSLLDEPAVAPVIDLQGGSLTVTANNASLTEVLRQVGSRTGMQVEGAQHDQRIFGTYGPGRPTDVLSSLLYDSGYNMMLVGMRADGAPERLVLSPRATTTPATQAAAAATANRSADDDEDDEPAQQPTPPLFQRPDTGAQPPPNGNPNQPRTPQQMLEELQRMRQGQGGMGQQPQDAGAQQGTPQ